jgi:hypothetical protein
MNKWMSKFLIAAAAAALAALTGVGWAQPAHAYPAGVGASVSLSTTCVDAGATLDVFGQDFAPNAAVRLTLGSDAAVLLGFAQADSTGALAVSVTVPADVAAGTHTLQVDSATDTAFATVQVGCGGAGGGAAAGGGGLSQTGVAVVGTVALGIALLTGGLLMVLAGRRHKTPAG